MTKSTYEVTKNDMGKLIITRTDQDGRVWSFLEDPANSDYQRYLEDEAKTK
jgi:hypothetical protein